MTREISFWTRFWRRVFGCRFGHRGFVVGTGRIVVLEKKNLPYEKPIPGVWNVRKCHVCGEVFAHLDDRVDQN